MFVIVIIIVVIIVIIMFHIASLDDVKTNKLTDVYFSRCIEILKKENIKKNVLMEIRAYSLPKSYKWGVLAGVEELVLLITHLGLPVNLYAMPEGSIFYPEDVVVMIEGEYTEFGVYETVILGLLCQASGVATKASRCRKAAGDKLLLSFGARRMHPAVAPMIERAAFIGGCDGTSVIKAAQLINEQPYGTMPHAFILTIGDSEQAFKLFDKNLPPYIKRIVVVDTLNDEKYEAIKAAEVLGKKLLGVRLDTPSSRRGNMKRIIEEVRWELNIRGYEDVKIFISGGIDEDQIRELKDIVEGFGVGTSLSNAEVINFSMDIVEVEDKPFSKRGKLSGRKQVLRCNKCLSHSLIYEKKEEYKYKCKNCNNEELEPLIELLIKDGQLIKELPSPQVIREYLLSQLKKINI